MRPARVRWQGRKEGKAEQDNEQYGRDDRTARVHY